MFKPVRVVATVVLLVAIAMTFMGAFLLDNALLCLIMVIVEYLAYLWCVRSLQDLDMGTDAPTRVQVLLELDTLRQKREPTLHASPMQVLTDVLSIASSSSRTFCQASSSLAAKHSRGYDT